jgi:predicted double-glycine peptidase
MLQARHETAWKRLGRTAVMTGAVLAALLPFRAAAEVRLGTETTGSNYQVKVMSWWEIPFRSVVRQAYDFSCGSAAVSTLLTHHFGRPTPERESFAAMWKNGDQAAIRKVGFSMFDMKTFLNKLGYGADGYRLTVDELGKMRRPAIVLLDLKGFKHFVVVKGIRGDRVLVGDPMLGLSEYSSKDFAKYWNGIALVAQEGEGMRAPRYDLASDWGPWSTAPLEEEGAMRVAASDLTTHLPPDYQISPQILLDVRVGTVQ